MNSKKPVSGNKVKASRAAGKLDEARSIWEKAVTYNPQNLVGFDGHPVAPDPSKPTLSSLYDLMRLTKTHVRLLVEAGDMSKKTGQDMVEVIAEFRESMRKTRASLPRVRLSLPDVTFVMVENRWPERVKRFCAYIREHVRGAKIVVKDNLPQREDKAAYDRLCSIGLHECFETDYAIVCQLDGFPVRWDLWDPEFLNFDYIGAPWACVGWLRYWGFHYDWRVGNGGCSLRSKRLCVALSEATKEWEKFEAAAFKKSKLDGSKAHYNHPDDVFISGWMRPKLEKQGIRFADCMTAARFSREYPVEEHAVVKASFGFHDTRLYPEYAFF